MSGTFTIGERKVRPGTYFRRTNRGGVEVVGATNGVVAAVFQSNWGPLNEQFEMDVTMKNNIADYYGNGTGTEIIEQAFIGGAVTIRAVRIGGDDGVQASLKLKLAETDQDAVILKAAYPGNREFTVSIRTNLMTGERQCVIYEGVEIFEQYSFPAGDGEPKALVEAVKASKNFNAVLIGTGTGVLSNVTQVAFTGGQNPTVTNSSYSKGTEVLERYKWNTLICDTDEVLVHLILQSFAQTSYETGHLGMAVIGGTRKTAIKERIMQAATYNDEKVVYVLAGWRGSDNKDYEGYLAAARIGGMIAQAPSNTSLTHTVIKNATTLLEPFTNGEIINAEKRGCIVLSLNDSNQIWIDKAINTLVTPDAEMDEGWKKIRRTKTRFEMMDRINSTIDKYVGKVDNSPDGRATIIATGVKVLNEMVGESKLFAGATMYEDPAHPAEGDSAWFIIDADDIDSAEHIYVTYRYRFSQLS